MIGRLSQLHEEPPIIAFAQRREGQALMIGSAIALLLFFSRYAPWDSGLHLVLAAIAVPATAAFPERRRHILSLLAVATLPLYAQPHWSANFTGSQGTLGIATHYAVILLVAGCYLGLLFGLFWLARNLERLPSPMREYPVLIFHALVVLLVVALPWSASGLLVILCWRVSYLLRATSHATMRHRFAEHLYCLAPVWGPIGVPTPIGKGNDYLSRVEARSQRELAVSQLAGIKLLLLAFGWLSILLVFECVVFGNGPQSLQRVFGAGLRLNHLAVLMETPCQSGAVCLATVYLDFFRMALNIAVYGHIIVGCVRLFGFKAFRHVYKPLLATSVAEFWSRWSYYYKEVLTDFFFYPVFMRSSWAPPRLRMLLAVFGAAFVGNMYFFALWELPRLPILAPKEALILCASKAVYSCLLAFGISVSLMRLEARRRSGNPALVWAQVWFKRFTVGSFYAFVHIWNVGGNLDPLARLWWLLSIALGP